MERIEELIKLEEAWVYLSQDGHARRKRDTREREEGSSGKDQIKERVVPNPQEQPMIFKDPIYRFLTEIKDKPYFKRPLRMVSDPGHRDPNL